MLEVAAAPAGGNAVNVGPLGSRTLAAELADQLTSLYRLRHCGRTLHLRENPSVYGQMGRCVSPCLGDLDPNAYRRQLDLALGLFEGPSRAAGCSRRSTGGSPRRPPTSATSVPPRCCGGAGGWPGCWSGSRGSCEPPTPPRGCCWRATRSSRASTPSGSCAGGWPTGGRCRATPSSWSAPQAALARLEGGARTPVPAAEVDELRIVWGWLADNEPPELPLDPAPDADALQGFVAAAA